MNIDTTDRPVSASETPTTTVTGRMRHIGTRSPRLTIVLFILALVSAAAIASGVEGSLSPAGGFTDPASDAARAAIVARGDAGLADPNVFVIVTASSGVVPSDALGEAGAAIAKRLSRDGTIVDNYLSGVSPQTTSRDGRSGVITLQLGGNPDERHHLAGALVADLKTIEDRFGGAVRVDAGGSAVVDHATIAIAKSDLAVAEMIAAPLLLVLLVLIFRSVAAALLALAVGASSVVFTAAALRWIGEMTTVSAFALNLTTALGLGLAVDYSLLVITRFRKERIGVDDIDAINQTMSTAGRTVLFGALTTAAALSSLFVFPIAYLRSFALAGVAVVLIALSVSLIVLPAALLALGDRIDRWTVPSRSGEHTSEQFFSGVGRRVTRRPAAIAAATIAALLLLGAPFVGVKWAAADDRALPSHSDARIAHEVLREQFPTTALATATVIGVDAQSERAVRRFRDDVAALSSVGAVLEPRRAPSGAPTVAFAFTAVAAHQDVAGTDMVRAIRALEAPSGAIVGGQHAEALDTEEAIRKRLPVAAGLMLASTLAMLALAFRSVVAPLKAIIVNALSLSAAFGAVVWIFQDGNLAGPLDFTATGTTEVTTPILMFCVAFGLSIDYEVILLSSIRERWDRHGDSRRAIHEGLGNSARIITASAVLLIVVFATFSVSGITMVKLFGIGLAVAIFIDATLVRLLLAPSLMSLAGHWNWWPATHSGAPTERADRDKPNRRPSPSPIVRPDRRALDLDISTASAVSTQPDLEVTP